MIDDAMKALLFVLREIQNMSTEDYIKLCENVSIESPYPEYKYMRSIDYGKEGE